MWAALEGRFGGDGGVEAEQLVEPHLNSVPRAIPDRRVQLDLAQRTNPGGGSDCRFFGRGDDGSGCQVVLGGVLGEGGLNPRLIYARIVG